jgi:transcriptional regulator with XRE-family HTH domain
MTNKRLRVALERAGLTTAETARAAEVDPKTVERWLAGRIPHPRHRRALASRVEEDEDFLWPDAYRRKTSRDGALAEIVSAYAYRSDLEIRHWWDLFVRSEKQIDLLGYTLYFLPQQHPGLTQLLRQKAEDGCRIRLIVSDPASPNLRSRDEEEHQAITLVARIESTLEWLEPLLECEQIDARFQDAALYSSIFRFDDQMLVTPHLYATPGHSAPLLHLKRLGSSGLFSRFEAHFEGIWADTRPVGEDRGRTHLRSGG